MLEAVPYTILVEPQAFVVRLDKNLIDYDSLVLLLDYMTLRTIQKKSKLTGKQAEQLAEEIQVASWQKVKHLFE